MAFSYSCYFGACLGDGILDSWFRECLFFVIAATGGTEHRRVSALAQLLLDPYYRTRHGFSVLVEKDFMSFGHPFHKRCAHGEGRGDKVAAHVATPDEGQVSPGFLQLVLTVMIKLCRVQPSVLARALDQYLQRSFRQYAL